MTTTTGTISYHRDAGGEQGTDRFCMTLAADGTWNIRVRTETRDTGVAREVTHILDTDQRPLSSHIVQWRDGVRRGDGWFVATAQGVEVHTWLAGQGLIHQSIQTHGWPAFIVPHAVVCDAYICATYDVETGGRQPIHGGVRSSPRADGTTGPLGDVMKDLFLTDLGNERISVRAGDFLSRHFLVESDNGATENLWVTETDLLLLRLRSDRLASTYELTQLETTHRPFQANKISG